MMLSNVEVPVLSGQFKRNRYLSIKKNTQAFTVVSLDEILAKIIGQFESQIATAEIKIEKSELGSVDGNPKLISILFQNLLDNAIKFRKQEGQTVISISSSIADVTHNGTERKTLLVTVEDNGIGILPENQYQVFDLFFKNHHDRKMKGSGVGLGVAKKIMTVHDGAISVESTYNERSKFILSFPLIKNK